MVIIINVWTIIILLKLTFANWEKKKDQTLLVM